MLDVLLDSLPVFVAWLLAALPVLANVLSACCCNQCKICENDCGWTVETGTADTSISGTVSITAANTIVTCDADAAAGTVEVNVSASVVASNDADQPFVFLKYQNTTTLWKAQLTYGAAGTLRIYENGTQRATVNTSVSGGASATITLCYGNGRVAATAAGQTCSYSVATASTSGLSAGVGVVALTAQADFSAFNYRYGAGENHPTCDACGSVSGPSCSADCCPDADSRMIVGIGAGLTDKATCPWCSQVEGEYTCTGGPCNYIYCDQATTCDEGCDGDGGGVCPDTWITCEECNVTSYPCIGTDVRVYIRVDGSNKCWLGARIVVSDFRDDSECGNGAHQLAGAWYETAIGDGAIVPCSGHKYTLTIVDGLACDDSHHGTTFLDWFPTSTPGCNGSWPATITVRSAA